MSKEIILKGILAGIFISIGCMAYLSVGGVIGACLFAFGLTCVICSKAKLFTGMAGYCFSLKDYTNLYQALFWNFVGCFAIGYLFNYDTSVIVDARLSSDLIKLFIGAVGTGIIMTFAVGIAKNQKNFIPVLFGVPIFILCGWPHCIADAFYYACDFSWPVIIPWGITIIGNFIGCHFNRIFDVKFI